MCRDPRGTICIQKIEGECQVLQRSCPLGCRDWPLGDDTARVEPPSGWVAAAAAETTPERRARLWAAYQIVPFPECLRKLRFPMPDWMEQVLADYKERIGEAFDTEGGEDLAECTA